MKKLYAVLICLVILILIGVSVFIYVKNAQDPNTTPTPTTNVTEAPKTIIPDNPGITAGTPSPTLTGTPSSETSTPNGTGSQTQSPETPTAVPTLTPDTPEKKIEFDLEGYSHKVMAGDYEFGIFTFDIPTVKIPDNSDISEKINKSVKDLFMEQIEGWQLQCEIESMDFNPEYPSQYIYTGTTTSSYSGNIVSFKLEVLTDYGERGIQKDIFCYNYSTLTGNVLDIKDIGYDVTSIINAAIDKSISMKNEYDFTDNYQNYIKQHICSTWFISDTELTLVYFSLSIAPEMEGIIEIPLSLESLTIG